MAWRLSNIKTGIAIAMDQLCRDNAYESITVQSICDAAGISRSMFYRVFDSKYAISTWHQNLVLKASIGEVGRSLDWYGGYVAAYSGWEIFPNMNKAAGQCEGHESIAANFRRTTRELLVDTIVNYKGLELTDSLDFQVDYFSNAGIIRAGKWVAGHSRQYPDGAAAYLVRCVPRDLFDLLDTPDHPNDNPRLSLSALSLLE